MKTREYRRKAVDPSQTLRELKAAHTRYCVKLLAFSLLVIALCIAVAICCTVFTFPHVSHFFVPVAAGVCTKLFMNCYFNLKMLRLLSLNTHDYAVWMSIQLNKGDHRKSYHLSDAAETYKKLSPDPYAYESEIIEALHRELKTKPANQIKVSVLCGLLFTVDCKKHRDTVFKAKYKSGAAGNMIHPDWIRSPDGDLPPDVTLDRLKDSFLSFWNSKI